MSRFHYRLKNRLMILMIFVCFIAQARVVKMASPAGKISAEFTIESDGTIFYAVNNGDDEFISKSILGVKIEGKDCFEHHILLHVDSTTVDATWQPVLGQESKIRNHYREYIFHLCDLKDKDLHYKVIFRLFDDGIGFRYEFPTQDKLTHFTLEDELTQFVLNKDFMAYWLPGDYEAHSYDYRITRVSQINSHFSGNGASNGNNGSDGNTVQTPLLLKSPSGLYVNIHEAALIDYPGMNLQVDPTALKLKVNLISDAVGNKAYLQTPFATPWRTILASKKATDILGSRLVLNLNKEPEKLDYSWIKPMKAIGLWREMRLGQTTWSYSDNRNVALNANYLPSLKPNGRHGANDTNVEKYVDFAVANGFDGVLIEGWNLGWEDWYGHWKERVFDFVTPYPDFNVKTLSEYAHSANIHLIMHHETAGSVTEYERSLDTALAFMRQFGFPMAQTGYVGQIIPRGEHSLGQWMTNHFSRTADKFMGEKLLWSPSGIGRPTGLSRTYPNLLCEEIVAEKPYSKDDYGAGPVFQTILPFIKSVGGPVSYPSGLLQPVRDESGDWDIHTTLAQQLALFVTLYSPFRLAGDLPENYEHFKDAFRFIKEVPMDWSQTIYLDALPGEYLYVARKEKNGNRWYVGAITGETARTASISLKFLDSGKKYKATIYADASGAHFKTNPTAFKLAEILVDNHSKIPLFLAPGGGAAISLSYASAAEVKRLPKLSEAFLKSWKRK